MQDIKQPWIHSAIKDILFILLPPFAALMIVAFFPVEFKNSATMPLAYWVVLIVMIDVAHVYSTLYRTYLNPVEFKNQQALLTAIPVFCYVLGVILYSFDALIFWRVLAYLAVFHFIRQQYGFMRLYSRQQTQSTISSYIDTATIYIATIYPLIYWHCTSKRNFNWFIEGDFLTFNSAWLLQLSFVVYLLIIAAYIAKETITTVKSRYFNLPKNAVVAGTVLSWYFGIIYFNGDIAFTTLNVVSHGIPYMALIWFYERKQRTTIKFKQSSFSRITFSKYGIICFVAVIILLAYFEEGLWDGLIWKEHASFFRPFANLPAISNMQLLTLIVPLLSLPQSTHYVLDGFIWKIKKGKRQLKNI